MYIITNYTKKKAKKLNVKVYPSTKKNKKIDIYKNNKYITSVGDINYLDYGYYLKLYGKKIADKRKKLYKLRHNKTRKIKGSNSYYADNLLW